MLSFKNLKVSHLFSSFLFQSGIPKLSIQKSFFSRLTDACIKIESSNIHGVSGSTTTAVSLTGSFNCTDTIFSNNSAPAFGAAISVISSDELIANIENTVFEFNKAAMGAAVYFCAEQGTITVDECTFKANSANTGSDLFIAKAHAMSFTGSTVSLSDGISSFHFATDNMNPTFTQCKFFRNKAALLFMKNSAPTFTDCCFMNYDDVPPYTPIATNFFITTYGEGTTYTFAGCCINLHMADLTSIHNDVLNSELANVAGTENPDCDKCRVVPLPTPTVNASWSSRGAKEALIAVCAFAIISIVGVSLICLCGMKLQHEDEWDRSSDDINDLQVVETEEDVQ